MVGFNAKQVLSRYFQAKQYYVDMISDLYFLFSLRAEIFSKTIDDFQAARVKYDLIDLIDKRSKSITHKYRMYVISNVQYVSLAYIDIPEENFYRIYEGIKNELLNYTSIPTHKIEPWYTSTVYLFNGKNVVYSEHIDASHLSWILNSLKHENVIDYSQESGWTTI